MNSDQKNINKVEFTARIKEALIFSEYDKKTLAELAEMFGACSRGIVHAWLNGKKIPSAQRATLISKVLGVSFEWLLTGNGNMEGFEMQTADEIAIISKYRDLKRAGKRKVIKLIFTECAEHEIHKLKPEDRIIEKQATLKLVPFND